MSNPSLSLLPLPLAITQGDPCGIGPEIIARAWAEDPAAVQGAMVAGDLGVMQRAMALLPSAMQRPVQALANVSALQGPLADGSVLPVLPVTTPCEPMPWGRIDARAGRMAGESVVWATRAALRGEVAGLVTAPLHKEALHAAGAPYNAYPGHTELLQAEAARHQGLSPADLPVRMMLASEELRTVLVSIHVSLREALDAITVPHVLQTLQITHEALLRMLGRAPRMALAGVNPHAGEGGLFGREEIEVLVPALQAARERGWMVSGPHAPDTVFMQARHTADRPGAFDVVIAMYHDQGLIPVKYLGLDQGVNVTLGLPLVRTSPDHGTAFDIAGQGRADASSLVQALRMARRLAAP